MSDLDFGHISEDQSPEEIAEQVEAVYASAEATPEMITITITEVEQWGEPCVLVIVLPDSPLPYADPDVPEEERKLCDDATRSERVAWRMLQALHNHDEWNEDFMLAVMQPMGGTNA